MRWLLLLLLGLARVWAAEGDDAGFKGMVWHNSLQPPFEDVNQHGHKQLENWVHGGSVQLKKNFVRLTPDKPSRTGYVFNKHVAHTEDFKVLLRFRVSGESERLSGDGMAFWYTSAQHFAHGSIMGSAEVFAGFGVLFDTFENDGNHRDIQVVAGNGKTPVYSAQFRNFPGCEANFRRWEGRGDFHIEQETVVKLSFNQGKHVVVEVDALGTGEFVTCVDTDLSEFLPKPQSAEANWRQRAHFAMSATTGALHDNHDVLEVIVTQAAMFNQVMEAHEQLLEEPNALLGDNVTSITDVGSSVNVLAYEVKDLDGKLSKLHHEIEHEVEKIAHKLEKLIDQLAQQERKLESRVVELERKTASEVMRNVETRLGALEQSLQRDMGQQSKKIGEQLKRSSEEGSSYRFQFLLFVVLVLAAFGYLAFTLLRVKQRVAKNAQYLA